MMRMREKTLQNYGISKEREKELYALCRTLTPSDARYGLLRDASKTVNSISLTMVMVESLVDGASYDTLSQRYFLPMKRDDFYAYRRKTLAEFNRRLEKRAMDEEKRAEKEEEDTGFTVTFGESDTYQVSSGGEDEMGL